MQLLDLIPQADLQRIGDTFEAAVGIPVIFTDAEGRPLTDGYDPDRFCRAFVVDTDVDGRSTCLWCGRQTDREDTTLQAIQRGRAEGRPVLDICPGGFLDAAMPIVVEGRALGYGIFGRALGAPPDLDRIRRLATENGLDVAECERLVMNTPVTPVERVEAVAEHLEAVTDIVIRVAADNHRSRLELAMAGDLQQGLVPRKHYLDGFDTAVSFRPATATGGDFVNAFRLGGGDCVFYVGDVSGSGVPAALVMSLLSGVLGAARHANVWPADLLTRLNAAFAQHFSDERYFATMLYARYVASGSVLLYANAGHEHARIIRARSGEVEELAGPPGHPLGFAARQSYAHGRTTMAPDDTLVLFTDGLVERKAPDGSWISPDVLDDTLKSALGLPVAEGAARVVAAFDSLADGAHRADDQGLLMARREVVSVVNVPGVSTNSSDCCGGICADLRERGVPEVAIDAIHLSLDEAVTNAAEHGYSENEDKLVRVRYSVGPRQVKITVTDEGPGIWHAGAKPIQGGQLADSGYGLAMISRSMDHVEWSPGGNELFMVKEF